MKIIVELAILAASIFLAFSCKDSSTNSTLPSAPRFAVYISVMDTLSNPVPHLRISCWNKLSAIAGKLPVPSDTVPKTLASSKIRLALATRARVWLASYDMDGKIVLAHFSDQTLWDPGIMGVTFVTGDFRPPWVLKCRCIVKDSLGNTLYRDSVYTLCWQPYADRSILGWTSPSGTFLTTDSLRFPNVLSLPPLVHTSDTSSVPLGTFSLSDTLTFVLTDTANHVQQVFEKVVHKDMHDTLRFVWQPTMRVQPSIEEQEKFPGVSSIVVHQSSAQITNSKLYQNYPNPYWR